jgi:cation diffusion facilitator family transporter
LIPEAKVGDFLFTWLYRCFIKDYQNTQKQQVRAAYGKLSGVVGIVANVALAAAKFLTAAWSGSLAVAADAINNLSDASSSVVSLVGFRMASKPADEEHPYGHARSEYLSGLIVSVLIIVVGVELLRGSIEKVLFPTSVQFRWATVAVLAVSILVKWWLAAFNRATGRLIASETLIATAADSRNDVIATSAVLLSSLIAHYTGLYLDGWMGIAVAVFIIASGIGLVKDTLDPLLGSAPDPQLVQAIEEHIAGYPGIINSHDLLLHDYGPGRRFGSVHVEMDADIDALDSHHIIDNIERDALTKFNLHLVVHLDPVVMDDE